MAAAAAQLSSSVSLLGSSSILPLSSSRNYNQGSIRSQSCAKEELLRSLEMEVANYGNRMSKEGRQRISALAIKLESSSSSTASSHSSKNINNNNPSLNNDNIKKFDGIWELLYTSEFFGVPTESFFFNGKT